MSFRGLRKNGRNDLISVTLKIGHTAFETAVCPIFVKYENIGSNLPKVLTLYSLLCRMLLNGKKLRNDRENIGYAVFPV